MQGGETQVATLSEPLGPVLDFVTKSPMYPKLSKTNEEHMKHILKQLLEN